jgi:hypothetical protein
MNIRTRLALPFTTLLLLACAAQRPEIASMPPDVRASWDRCQPAVNRWCADHSHGSPTEERDCVSEASRGYASQADDAARATYIRSHGCAM